MVLVLLASLAALRCPPAVAGDESPPPLLACSTLAVPASELARSAWAERLRTEADIPAAIAAMTLAEKVGQRVQADVSTATPDDVRQRCREIIQNVAQHGGYIMDASAIVQNDAKVENVRAMTEATLEYGVYSQGHLSTESLAGPQPESADARPGEFLRNPPANKPQPGECYPWHEKKNDDQHDFQGQRA